MFDDYTKSAKESDTVTVTLKLKVSKEDVERVKKNWSYDGDTNSEFLRDLALQNFNGIKRDICTRLRIKRDEAKLTLNKRT